jgi:hypothetical protein
MNIKLQQNGIMENIVLDTQKRSIIFPDCKIKFSCDNDKYSFIRIKSNNESAIEQSIDVIWIQNNYSVKPGINAKSMQAKSYDTIEQDTIEYVFMNLLL